MRVFLLLICFGCLKAKAQDEINFIKMVRDKGIKVKELYQYDSVVRDGRMVYKGFSKSFFDKDGNLKMSIYYDSTNKKIEAYKWSVELDQNNNLKYGITKRYRYDYDIPSAFLNWRKKLWKIDTSVSNPNERFYYKTNSHERKAGRITKNEKNEVLEVEILIRYFDDSTFYIQERRCFANSKQISSEWYSKNEEGTKLKSVNYYIRDSIGRLVAVTGYDVDKLDKPRSTWFNFYNKSNLLERSEEDNYEQVYLASPPGATYVKEERVHKSYYYECDENGILIRSTVYRNNVLNTVTTSQYKYYKR